MVSKRKSTSTDHHKAKKIKLTTTEWPEHFVTLLKIFKAINTVLAFVTSKRQLATSFSSIRTSVERLLQSPLELSKVAEIKALLPDLVNFAYAPASDLLPQEERGNPKSYDYSQIKDISSSSDPTDAEVLVLEFHDAKSRRATGSSATWTAPSTHSPAAVKKLIEARNARFEQAVDELLQATPSGEDPAELLIAAAQSYLPVDPNRALPMPSAANIVPTPQERPPIIDVISEIKETDWYSDQIVHQRSVEAKEPEYGEVDPPISERILQCISEARNVEHLYSHQAHAINAIRSGKHTVVSTSTASGKSVIYQIPILCALEEDQEATAFLVFPTKALAQDQKASLSHLLSLMPGLSHLQVATYDGDTPKDERLGIRENSSIILTNFDTLHASILPNEESWRSYFKRIKIFAVDELHYYTGQFGGHVSQIMRRFRRVCAALGNRQLRFISCSATLANPAEYMCKIFALEPGEVEVVSNDGAPSGRKEYLIWNPGHVDSMASNLGRRSSLTEASWLMRTLMKRGVRVILFCKIRKVCELAMKIVKSDLSNEGRLDILDQVRSYRGGYTQEDRRKIEREAFSGQLLGIIATNALELGVDIGVLDAVIMLGFPITLSNFRQQAGRAGRRSRDSLAIMVADPFPVDQHYVQHPGDLNSSLQDLPIDVDNEVVLEAHLQCAAYEMPLTREDKKWFGPSMIEICETKLRKDDDGWYQTNLEYLPHPSSYVSIRGAQEEKYMVVEVRESPSENSLFVLEEIEYSRGIFELYEGGVFMHQGSSFIVKEVHHDSKVAKLIRADVNYTTSPRDTTRIEPLQTLETRFIREVPLSFGRVEVVVSVFGFFKLRHGTILDAVECMTPPWRRHSTGFWLDLPDGIIEELRSLQIDCAGAIHSAEHAFLNQFALSEDVKTDCRTVAEDYSGGDSKIKRRPRLMFYDSAGKTGGTSHKAFEHGLDLFRRAWTVVSQCGCEAGCTSCIQSMRCKDANLIATKVGASLVLARLLGYEWNPASTPPAHYNTDQCLDPSSLGGRSSS